MLKSLWDRVRNNEATEEERNAFASEIKIIVKARKSKINKEVARSTMREYDVLVNEVCNHTYMCVIKYKYNSKITTVVYKLVDQYTIYLYRKTRRNKVIPPELIDTFTSSQRPENLRYFRNDPNNENLSFDEVLANKKDCVENDLIYDNYIEKIKGVLIKNHDTVSLKILEGKLKGYTDAKIAKTLGVSTPKVNCIKRENLMEAVSQVLC